MEHCNKPLEPIEEIKKGFQNNDQDSLQYNLQDLDQEQNVDVTPYQFNYQIANAVIYEQTKDFTGKIVGTTYSQISFDILPCVKIKLYFGNETQIPISMTESDKFGKFEFENLPAGYYTLQSNFGDKLISTNYLIKVLSCQTTTYNIFLTETDNPKYNCNECKKTNAKTYNEKPHKINKITYVNWN